MSILVVLRQLLSYVYVFLSMFYFFFFQAEDGIRDLVRSRGLGDVYKRQLDAVTGSAPGSILDVGSFSPFVVLSSACCRAMPPVSYTHLTLPTSDLV